MTLPPRPPGADKPEFPRLYDPDREPYAPAWYVMVLLCFLAGVVGGATGSGMVAGAILLGGR